MRIFSSACYPELGTAPGCRRASAFWKARIEEQDADRTFRIGVLYGPSGCGKSSLVKAGLLPRLAPHVQHIYLECRGSDDEARLQGIVSRRLGDCDPAWTLVELLTAIRRGQCGPDRGKLLLVLDQFEQWLNANDVTQGAMLLQALRQCDGGRIQCLLLVRDDFWMAITRAMQELASPIVASENAIAVDLFDPLHAGNVLAEFGRSYGRLPKRPDLSREQQTFLDQAVQGLSSHGKVVPVQLALFAEMMKGKIWSPEALRTFGGAQGVTIAYLEETFSDSTAPLRHRVHQRAARRILRALLPESGVDMRGFMRSRAELLQVSGYADRRAEFDELMKILDGETRLLTPVDPAVAQGERGDSADPGRGDDDHYYQLTHDHLLQPLREWLASKQKERRGDAHTCYWPSERNSGSPNRNHAACPPAGNALQFKSGPDAAIGHSLRVGRWRRPLGGWVSGSWQAWRSSQSDLPG
jgi:eukaryotic-like serine/threonine-protein kinase